MNTNKKILNPKVANIYSLTPLQEGMLFHSLADPEAGSYILQSIYDIQEELIEQHLVDSLHLLAQKYEVLRTAIVHEKLSRSRQVVLKEREIEYEKINLSNLSGKNQTEKITSITALDVSRGFRLQEDTLIRIKYIDLGSSRGKLIWTMHHIIVDGWCMSILFGEFMNFYNSLKNGISEAELEQRVEEQRRRTADYGEYINWLEIQDKERGLAYWKGLLADYEETAEIRPMGKPEPCKEQVAQAVKYISQDISDKLVQVAAENHVTINNVVEAAWGIVLQIYNNSRDVVFGKVVSGRNAELKGIEKMVGLFINTVPFRVKCDETTRISQLLQELGQQGTEGSSYDYCSLAEIQSQTNHKSELIKTLYVFENYYVDEENLKKFKEGPMITLESSREQTNYPLSLLVSRKEERLICKMLYNPGEFPAFEVNGILERLETVLQQIAAAPEQRVSDLELISEPEKKLILDTFHQGNYEYPYEKTVVELFEEQAERTPDRIAVCFEKEQLTYEELNQKANQLAGKLRESGVKPNDFVALLTERSIELVVAIYAVIKAGGAYVPIDPAYPAERIQYILQDCAAKALLVYGVDTGVLDERNNKNVNEKDAEKKMRISLIDMEDTSLFEGASVNPDRVNKSSDLIYCIYTSGTTGKPKGVMLEHRNVVRLLITKPSLYDFKETDVWLMFHSYCFDFSVWEMYGATLFGGKLIVLPKKTAQDSYAVMEVLREAKVTVLNQIPSAFYNMMELDIPHNELSLRYLIFGGEALSTGRLKRWHQRHPEVRIINMYGITETTVHVTYKELGGKEIEQGVSNIGTAIPTLSVYILKENKLCGIGIPGEICVAGPGLARGYLNEPELTTQKFIANPWGSGKLYRSGDLAKWLPNGDLEYLGRIDEQVKVRGFRIELGEIENALVGIDKIKSAAVIVRKEEGQEAAIHAYFQAEEKLRISGIREQLSKILPEYMLPAFLMQLDNLPITENGKLDRKALPRIKAKSEKLYIAPRNETEVKIAKVFEEILRTDRVGVSDSFFELGGDSIKAIRIVSKLREAGYEVSVRDVMKKYTVETLAEIAVSAAPEKKVQKEVTGSVITTPIMETFEAWELKKPQHFNQSVMLYADTWGREKIDKVLTALVVHHDILRAVYRNKTLVIPSIAESRKYELIVFDFKEEVNIEVRIDAECTRLQSSIDLESGPLMKTALFLTAAGNYLLLCLHHLVVDTVSWQILTEDFYTALEQAGRGNEIKLPAKTASYQEWAAALAEYRNLKYLQSEKDYWRKITEDIAFGLIREDGAWGETGYSDINLDFDKKETEDLLYRAGKAFHTEINDLLLCALGRAVNSVTGQKRVAVGLEGHGREEIHKNIAIDRTVGWFTSIYPIILDYREKLNDCIITTKEMLRKVPNHGMGYGLLKKELKGMDASLYFNYLGELDSQEKKHSLVQYSQGVSVAKENRMPGTINLNGFIRTGRLYFVLTYDRSKYQAQTMQKLAEAYKTGLKEIIQYCSSQDKSVRTAADFDAVDLSLEDFGMITNLL